MVATIKYRLLGLLTAVVLTFVSGSGLLLVRELHNQAVQVSFVESQPPYWG
jgi:hypothetical protein